MAPQEFSIYFNYCINKGITIYPVPTNTTGSVMYIEVNNRGDCKLYTDTTGKKLTYTPSNIYKQIEQLYKSIYLHNNPKKQQND